MPAHQAATLAAAEQQAAAGGGAVALYKGAGAGGAGGVVSTMDRSNPLAGLAASQGHQLSIRKAPSMPKPVWHAPWKLYRVISGHMGWVRCCTVEPGNEWFATGAVLGSDQTVFVFAGAADRVIKVWDLASGKLKVSLTGHVSVVRGLAVSARQPYLFSCGEDRQVGRGAAAPDEPTSVSYFLLCQGEMLGP